MIRSRFLAGVAGVGLAWMVVALLLQVAFAEQRLERLAPNAILISPETREIVVLPSVRADYVVCAADWPDGPRRGCISVAALRKAAR